MNKTDVGKAEVCPFCFMENKNSKTHQECIWAFMPLSLVKTTFQIVNVDGFDLYVPMNYQVEPARQWLVN